MRQLCFDQDHNFIVSCKPAPDDLWGIYLVDIFDNMVLIKEEEGFCLLGPIPVQNRQRPPMIPDQFEPDTGDALVFLENVYAGDGLKGVPHGEVKRLRLLTYNYAFWMGQFEVTNRQYARFDPTHDSRHEHGTASLIGERAIGPPLSGPDQPVVRISWQETMAFCDWVSTQIGETVSLPTEAQWEYACRAGSAEPFFYGGPDDDFSPFANVADATLKQWATFNETRRSADQIPRDERFDDGALVTVDVGSYRPNAWGLHDMHGNVWEWTRSSDRLYPYQADDGRNADADQRRKVVRGGSWYDRPPRCRSAFRLNYPAWRKVYNVGFRVVFDGKTDPKERIARIAD